MTNPQNLPPIRVTVEIPSELALEMQRVATEATLKGVGQAQVTFMDAWMRAGTQVFEQVGAAYAGAFRLPGPGSGSGR